MKNEQTNTHTNNTKTNLFFCFLFVDCLFFVYFCIVVRLCIFLLFHLRSFFFCLYVCLFVFSFCFLYYAVCNFVVRVRVLFIFFYLLQTHKKQTNIKPTNQCHSQSQSQIQSQSQSYRRSL